MAIDRAELFRVVLIDHQKLCTMLFILDGDPRPVLRGRLCSVGSEGALVDTRGRIASVRSRRLECRNGRVQRAGRGALPQVPLRRRNGGLMLLHRRCGTPSQP